MYMYRLLFFQIKMDQKNSEQKTVQVAQKEVDQGDEIPQQATQEAAMQDSWDRMVRFLMTNPDTGQEMSYAESRERYG